MTEHQNRRVVVVTGASAGVGRATARLFAEEGADLALLARGRAGLEAVAAEVREAGGRALPIEVDVADPDAVEAAAEQVERELGPIDAWVNDAMVSVFAPVKTMTPEDYRRVTEVNYLGTVHGTLSALRRMRPRDRGVIVQVSSALAFRSIPLQSAYCAAKHAVVGFTDSLRTELLHDGSAIRISAVHLPAVNTPQFDWVRSKLDGRAQPVPPIYQPEVAARAIVHAADHPQRDLFVGRSTWMAILGQRLAPSMLDRYLARTGYEAQQTDQPETPRPDNLDQPLDVDDDWGAHGRFSDQAAPSSPALQLALHPRAVAGTVAMAFGAVALGVLGTARRRAMARDAR